MSYFLPKKSLEREYPEDATEDDTEETEDVTDSRESQKGRSGEGDLCCDLSPPTPGAAAVFLTSIIETNFSISCDIFENRPNKAVELTSEEVGKEDPNTLDVEGTPEDAVTPALGDFA